MQDFERVLSGRRVLVTGHTGFTGGWLVLWLREIGCVVSGLALPPNTEPNLFVAAGVQAGIQSHFGDIREFQTVKDSIARADPEVIFHLAAQPLVSRSFSNPIETIATNAIGTAHVLEAARFAPNVKAVVCVTTDKVYAEEALHHPHREDDMLGGKDPYSASKACAEMIAFSYAATLSERGNKCRVATARGGNIIGGGDWSQDRIVPDFVRAVSSSSPLVLRRPAAVRPWQHVLALVHGYLALAGHLLSHSDGAGEGWNFGPSDSEAISVSTVVQRLGAVWALPEVRIVAADFPETNILRLDSAKARGRLGWCPPIDIDATVQLTGTWYRGFYADNASAHDLTLDQIRAYRQKL